MLEIKGKINTAICYAKIVEDEAIEQIRRMCDYPVTQEVKIRIMPDVHAGKGCTIGTTMTIIDKIVPNVVGVDIGCGMYTVNLGKAEIDFEKAAGLSVRDLQEIFGFGTPQAIYKWQHGTAMPTIDNLVVLAAVLQVKVDDILVVDAVAQARVSA